MESEFNVGDLVEIVNYGHLMWVNKNSHIGEMLDIKESNVLEEKGNLIWYDLSPELVGQKAIVREVRKAQQEDKYQYALHGLSKSSWYNPDQLKMISPNLNRL